MEKTLFLAIISFLIVYAIDPHHNTLTSQEKKEGWKLLFDGKSTAGWHNYGTKGVGSAWQIDDDALTLYSPNRAGNKTPNGGDLVTNQVFSGDFECKFDWKVSSKANSGVFFFVAEKPENKEIYHTGMEFQVTDNGIFGEGPDNEHRAGDLFGLISARVREPKPVGEWNQVHLILKKGTLNVFMNGFQLHEIRLNSTEWKELVAKSGLKAAPIGLGQYVGQIGLQDWGSQAWYRNIKIRPL
jgi:hypothetical protein